MAYYELKCGAEFDRTEVVLLEHHVATCSECIARQHGRMAQAAIASGLRLDAIGEDIKMLRSEGETDESFRARVCTRLSLYAY